MTKGYVVFTTYVIDVDTNLPSEEGAHSPSGQTGLLSSPFIIVIVIIIIIII
jgi:hypothetical protein